MFLEAKLVGYHGTYGVSGVLSTEDNAVVGVHQFKIQQPYRGGDVDWIAYVNGNGICGITAHNELKVNLSSDNPPTQDDLLNNHASKAAIGYKRYARLTDNFSDNWRVPKSINRSVAVATDDVYPRSEVIAAMLWRFDLDFNDPSKVYYSELIAESIKSRLEMGIGTDEAIYEVLLSAGNFPSGIALFKDRMVAFRSPKGTQPICYGEIEDGNAKYKVVLSENGPLKAYEDAFMIYLRPGQILSISEEETIPYQIRAEGNQIDLAEILERSDYHSDILDRTVFESYTNLAEAMAKYLPKSGNIMGFIPNGGRHLYPILAERWGIRPEHFAVMKNRYHPKNPETVVAVHNFTARPETVKGKVVSLADNGVVTGISMDEAALSCFLAGAEGVNIYLPVPPVAQIEPENPRSVQRFEHHLFANLYGDKSPVVRTIKRIVIDKDGKESEKTFEYQVHFLNIDQALKALEVDPSLIDTGRYSSRDILVPA